RRLVDEHVLLVEAAELALDDLVDDVGRLARVLHLRAVDSALLLEHVGRHVFAAGPRGVGRGHLQGDLLQERLEVLGARDEVGLAVEFDEHADLAPGVDVGANQSFTGGAAGLLRRLRQATLAENRDGIVEVAIGLLERSLALHHAGTGQIAELLDEGRGNFHGRTPEYREWVARGAQSAAPGGQKKGRGRASPGPVRSAPDWRQAGVGVAAGWAGASSVDAAAAAWSPPSAATASDTPRPASTASAIPAVKSRI